MTEAQLHNNKIALTNPPSFSGFATNLIPYTNSQGEFKATSNFSFDGTNFAAPNINATTMTLSSLGNNEILFTNGSAQLSTSANLTYNSGTGVLTSAGGAFMVGSGGAVTCVNLNAGSGTIQTTGSGIFGSVNAGSGAISTTGTGTFGAIVGTSLNVGGGTVTCGAVSASGSVSGTFSGNGASINSINASNISSGTLNAARLAASGVSPGTYTSATIVVDAAGRVTSATNGGTGGGTGVVGNLASTYGGVSASGWGAFIFRIPIIVDTETIDGTDNLVLDTTLGSPNYKLVVNAVTRGIGTEALQVTDTGSGAGYFGISALTGVRMTATPPGYSGGAILRVDSNSPKTNGYYFFQCLNPDVVSGSMLDRFHVDSGGNLSVFGSITAGTKDFSIPHPLLALTNTTTLLHTSVESPRANLLYRGSVTLVSGVATVDLDAVSGMTSGTLAELTDLSNADVFLQNKTSSTSLTWQISGHTLTITCSDVNSSDRVSWLVLAERKASTMPGVLVDVDGHKVVEVARA